MKVLKGLFFATFVSIVIGMIISFYPKIDGNQLSNPLAENRLDQTVVLMHKPILFSQATLVSFLKQISLNYSFKQVELEGDTLFIKIMVPEHEVIQEFVFQDAFQILHKLYQYTTNINQIYLRFVLTSDTHKVLLLSFESNRDLHMQDDYELEMDQKELEAFIKGKTKIIYGTGWNQEYFK